MPGDGTTDHDAGDGRIAEIKRRLEALDHERERLAGELEDLRRAAATRPTPPAIPTVMPPAGGVVTMASSTAEKIALFRRLFRGREDVFPRRWENARTGKAGYSPACRNEWVRGVCGKPKAKCGECPHRAFLPVDDAMVRQHLQGRDGKGDFTAGVYPMLPDETCWFLAADFDKKSWARDVAAFLQSCRDHDVPAALERSRSGNGGHVWIFFAESIPAAEARRLGAFLITETMERCPDIGFDSYDRFFPSQDTLPSGGFGNLIALPLQHRPRQNGNSAFVDDALEPFADQWAFLSGLRRLSRREVAVVNDKAAAGGGSLRLRLPIAEDDDEPWTAPPSRRRPEPPIVDPAPRRVTVVLANQVFIDRTGLPAPLVNRLARLAAFQNPEFYAAQAMRLPTFDKPRAISCAELFQKHVALPRGCLDEAMALLASLSIRVDLRDERQLGTDIGIRFLGQLTDDQQQAAQSLLAHDTGVLAATTAFGKTVVAAHVIAARGRNTLVLVHRRQLLDQWVARLKAFLDIDPAQIGVIYGGKKKPTGVIDVALMQSLVRKGEVLDLVADYGHLVVDECHHLSAVGFEAVARAAKAKYVLGLSATVTRKDGHHPIIFMQCGPVRHRVDARRQAATRPFVHRVVFRHTAFRAIRADGDERPSIQRLYAHLARDGARNAMIFDDVLRSLEAGRSPVIITERTDHLTILAERLSRFARNVIVLRGGMAARQRRETFQALQDVPDNEERVLIATGRYLGEGFDDARLDTLFLTMPISWRGTLAQYAGRLHRLHTAKREVVIYDYVDAGEPMLASMAAKREAGYRSLGYEPADADDVACLSQEE